MLKFNLFILMILTMVTGHAGLTVTSGPVVSTKTCTEKTVSTVYKAQVQGACAAIEYIYAGYEEYEVDFEQSFMLTESEDKKLRTWTKSLAEKHPSDRIKTTFSKDCRKLELKEVPYVFLTDPSYCQIMGLAPQGGCFGQEVSPGFDMPDSYITPDYLPPGSQYLEKAQVKVTLSTTTSTCQ